MARLGTHYFTRGRIMIGIAAYSEVKPGRPFNPRIHKILTIDLVKVCEGVTEDQAAPLLGELREFFVGRVSKEWLGLPGFVDLEEGADAHSLNLEES